MQLHDTLQVCLLALASWYPKHLLRSNRTILGDPAFCPDCQTTSEVMAWLQQREPGFLEKNAHLVIDAQQCAIYLIESSEKIPAYWIHCRGKMPTQTEERCSRPTLGGKEKEWTCTKNNNRTTPHCTLAFKGVAKLTH